MNIEINNNDGNLVLTPGARLDSFNAGDLESLLEKEITDEIKTLTINLEKVDFVSSRGVRVLVAAYKKMNGREITLQNANASIKEVLNLSGLLKIFNFAE